MSFVSLMVSSINDEARQTHLRLQTFAQRLCQGLKRKTIAQVTGKAKKVARLEILDTKVAAARNASAISLYRKHVMEASKEASAGSAPSRNWFSVAGWKDLKESFYALPQNERMHWQQLAKCVNFKRGKTIDISSRKRMVLAKPSDIGDAQEPQPPSYPEDSVQKLLRTDDKLGMNLQNVGISSAGPSATQLWCLLKNDGPLRNNGYSI